MAAPDGLLSFLSAFEAFMETRHNYIPAMGWELALGGALSLSLDQTRFMMALLLSIPAGSVVCKIPSSTLRHIYATLIGFALVYYPFGFGVIHAATPCTVVYLLALASPSHCGTLAWATCFPYLIYLHVVNASGANWQMGLLDFTGCEMVLVLKLITFAVSRQDAWRRARGAELSAYQDEFAVGACPDPLRYLSFLFGMGNLLAGPYLEYVDYDNFMEGRGLWDRKAARAVPSPMLPALKCMGTAAVYMALYQALIPTFNRDLLVGSFYASQGFWVRLMCCFMCSFTSQVKFVFAWKISEASLTMAGLNFDGWDDKTGAGKWGRYENVRFTTMLLSDSARLVVSHWNIGTARFLRRYVYERLTPKGSKPGFPQLFATQITSAIWHGLYPGYLLFFAGSAFWLNFATVIHKAEQVMLPPSVASSLPVRALKIAWTHLCLNSIATAFTVLDAPETLKCWSRIWYAPMAVIVLGSMVGPTLLKSLGGRRRARAGATKQE